MTGSISQNYISMHVVKNTLFLSRKLRVHIIIFILLALLLSIIVGITVGLLVQSTNHGHVSLERLATICFIIALPGIIANPQFGLLYRRAITIQSGNLLVDGRRFGRINQFTVRLDNNKSRYRIFLKPDEDRNKIAFIWETKEYAEAAEIVSCLEKFIELKS